MRGNKKIAAIFIITLFVAVLFPSVTFAQSIGPRHPQNFNSPVEITGLLLTSRVDASKLALVYSTIFMIISQYYVDTVIVEFYNYGLDNRASIDFYNSSYTSIAIQVDISVIPSTEGVIGGIQPSSFLQISYNETITSKILRNESLDQLMKISVLLNIFASFIYNNNTTISGLNMLNENIKPKIVGFLQNSSKIPEISVVLWGLIQGCRPKQEIVDNTPYATILQGNASLIFLNGLDSTSKNLTSFCNSKQYQVKLNINYLSAMLMILGIDVFSISIDNNQSGQAEYERVFVFPIVNVEQKELLSYVLSVLSGETILLSPIGDNTDENSTLNNLSKDKLSRLIQIIKSGNKTAADSALALAYKLLQDGEISNEDYMNLLQLYKGIYGKPPEDLDLAEKEPRDDVVLDLDKVLKGLENYQNMQGENIGTNNPPNKLPIISLPLTGRQIFKIITLILVAVTGIGLSIFTYKFYKSGYYREFLFVPRILYAKPPYREEHNNVLWCYWAIVRILSMKGYPKYEWETPREYLMRVKEWLKPEYSDLLEYLTHNYEKTKYGGATANLQPYFSSKYCMRMLRRLILEWRLEKSGFT